MSLLKFDEPRVYMSKHLPRMDELKSHVPTRPSTRSKRGPSVFATGRRYRLEEAGTQNPGPWRVRINQCLRCHTAREGELLGAFSYTWWQTPPAGARSCTTRVRRDCTLSTAHARCMATLIAVSIEQRHFTVRIPRLNVCRPGTMALQ